MAHASQELLILRYLEQGYSLTPIQALTLFQTMRLGARCWALRKQGYDIKSRMVRTNTNKRVAQYYLYQGDKQASFTMEGL